MNRKTNTTSSASTVKSAAAAHAPKSLGRVAINSVTETGFHAGTAAPVSVEAFQGFCEGAALGYRMGSVKYAGIREAKLAELAARVL